MKPRILICDTYYPDFLKSLPFDQSSTYEAELRKVLDRSFGTADFVSRNLRALGWDAVDVIANHGPLQRMWARENNACADVLTEQIYRLNPDIVFLQDLSIKLPEAIFAKVVAQLSCPWPGDDVVRRCDVVFTSFPHYVDRINALGTGSLFRRPRAAYNPLAFEPSVLERTFMQRGVEGFHRGTWDANGKPMRQRHLDCVFIGGVGNPSHWRYGMEVLETVAREIPTFKWWGYGLETLPADSALRRCYQGEAWGLQMYEILLQSKICLNRHGEVAEGYANNMRMFESTGCGALLLTESAPNLSDFFIESNGVNENPEVVAYDSPDDAVDLLHHFLDVGPNEFLDQVARNGQRRTLRDHTYQKRMRTVSETLLSMLCPA